jgi:hypothetical protein
MKQYLIAATFILMLVALLALPTACMFFKKSSSSSSDSVALSSEPLTSSWKMSRVSLEPPFPTAIPGFVVDQIIPKNTTWTIALSGNQLKPSYDGRPTWFNPMGITVNVKTPSITQSSDKKSVTLSGGGTIQADKLPGPLALLGAMSNLTIDYTDKIVVNMTGQDQISATITYNASGKYTGSKGPDSFNNSATIKYTGTRK